MAAVGTLALHGPWRATSHSQASSSLPLAPAPLAVAASTTLRLNSQRTTCHALGQRAASDTVCVPHESGFPTAALTFVSRKTPSSSCPKQAYSSFLSPALPCYIPRAAPTSKAVASKPPPQRVPTNSPSQSRGFVRVGSVDIPSQKRIEYSLQYIFGIGHTTAKAILADTNIENKRTFELTEEELNVLRVEVDKYETGDDLKRYVMQRINLLKEMRCYRGLRHTAGLPVRGQRTKTNARTRKGPRQAPVVKKKLARR